MKGFMQIPLVKPFRKITCLQPFKNIAHNGTVLVVYNGVTSLKQWYA